MGTHGKGVRDKMVYVSTRLAKGTPHVCLAMLYNHLTYDTQHVTTGTPHLNIT